MDPKFIEVGSTVFGIAHIISVEFAGGTAIMRTSAGMQYVFVGEDAAGLRRFFAPAEAVKPT